MKRSRLLVLISGLILAVALVVFYFTHVPGKEYERTYSFPEEEPTQYICCYDQPPPEVVLLFDTKGTTYGRVVGLETAEMWMSLETTESVLSSDSPCVRLDSLSPQERLTIEGVPLGFGESCNTFAIFSHFECHCNTTCASDEWVCNCPGVPVGSLPQAVPDDFPQDSIRSKPEFISETCTPCNVLSKCS
jgi:hypothetical protein